MRVVFTGVRTAAGQPHYRYPRVSSDTSMGKHAKRYLGNLLLPSVIRTGLPIIPQRQTVGYFLDRWLEDSVSVTVRPRTYARYAELVRLHISPTLGNIALSKLIPQHVQSLYTEKLRAGLSRRTVEHIHAVLRRALGQAFNWGLVARNLATMADAPHPRKTEIRSYSIEEARKLLQVIRGHRKEALYVLCLSVGLRQGEALGLRWEVVDLESRVLHVRVALQRFDGQFNLVEPRTSMTTRP